MRMPRRRSRQVFWTFRWCNPVPKLPTNMPITETQFEVQLRAAILAAFPWPPSDQITHQDSFSFKFGHATGHATPILGMVDSFYRVMDGPKS